MARHNDSKQVKETIVEPVASHAAGVPAPMRSVVAPMCLRTTDSPNGLHHAIGNGQQLPLCSSLAATTLTRVGEKLSLYEDGSPGGGVGDDSESAALHATVGGTRLTYQSTLHSCD